MMKHWSTVNSLSDKCTACKVLLSNMPSRTIKTSLSNSIPLKSKCTSEQFWRIYFSLLARIKDAFVLASLCPEMSNHYKAVRLRVKYPTICEREASGRLVDDSCRFVKFWVFCLKNLISRVIKRALFRSIPFSLNVFKPRLSFMKYNKVPIELTWVFTSCKIKCYRWWGLGHKSMRPISKAV